MAETQPTTAITDAPDAERLELRLDGELAGFLEYRRLTGRIAFTHTEVLPAFEGRGLGAHLVRAGLDLARAEGRKPVAICPFFRAWLARHPDEAAAADAGLG
jgi:predicted GNAT family acetyltransferase